MAVINEEIFIHSYLGTGSTAHEIGGHMMKYQGWSEGRENEGKMWARAFIVVSLGGNWGGSLNRFRLG